MRKSRDSERVADPLIQAPSCFTEKRLPRLERNEAGGHAARSFHSASFCPYAKSLCQPAFSRELQSF